MSTTSRKKFSNDLLALASREFSAVAKFFSVNAGMALKRIQECILLSYTQDLLDDNEFCLLYDANYANYPVFDHGQYTRFTLDAVSEEECLSSFRFRQLDIPYLAQVLRLPEKFICPNRTAALTEEALCILFRRIAYPCRYVDMMPQFGRSPQELSLIANKVMDEIYEMHGHLLTTIDHPWLTRAKLREMADAVHEVGAALPNCWGFVDATVNIRNKSFYTASRSCNLPFLTPRTGKIITCLSPHLFQS